jgi:hypothetical protein
MGKTSNPALESAVLRTSPSLYGLSKRDKTGPEYAPLVMMSAILVSAAAKSVPATSARIARAQTDRKTFTMVPWSTAQKNLIV